MTDEQIEQSIELIKQIIAERDAGVNAKVIEGVCGAGTADEAGSGRTRERLGAVQGRVCSGFERGRLCRRPERGGRIWGAGGAEDGLSAMADELVNLRVNVIATFGAAAAPVAKAASAKVSPPIPVIFVLGRDPVAEGLVTSLNRP